MASRYNKVTWLLLRGAKLSINRCSRKVTDGGWWERLYEASEIARCFISIERRIQKDMTPWFAICNRSSKNINVCFFFFRHINLSINQHVCHYSYKLQTISLADLSRSKSAIYFFIRKNALYQKKRYCISRRLHYFEFLTLYFSLYIFTKDRSRYIKTYYYGMQHRAARRDFLCWFVERGRCTPLYFIHGQSQRALLPVSSYLTIMGRYQHFKSAYVDHGVYHERDVGGGCAWGRKIPFQKHFHSTHKAGSYLQVKIKFLKTPFWKKNIYPEKNESCRKNIFEIQWYINLSLDLNKLISQISPINIFIR